MVKLKPVNIIKRGKCYQLYYYNPQGERRRISVGYNYQQAQRMVVKFTDWLLEGKDPETEVLNARRLERVKNIRIPDFYPVFLKRHASLQSASMQETYKYRFANISRCPNIVDIPMRHITKGIVLEYMHRRMAQDGVSEATVNREATFIRNMLNRAVDWDFIDRNPLQGIRLFKEAEKRNVYLTQNQAFELVSSLTPSIANIVEFAIYSGFRKENILSLRIESIRFHDLTPTAEVELVVKGGKRELYPIGSAAVEVLKKAIGKRKEGYVFLNPRTKNRYTSIHKTLNRMVRRIGLTVNGTKLRFHDLRHVYATWLYK